jgi:hypothetical protein
MCLRICGRGGKDGGGEEVGGFVFLSMIEEAKGVPHEAGPGDTMGNAVKATCLDENPHVLEMEMGPGSAQEILQRDERTVLGSLMDDDLRRLLR